jgi:hypothetical protein
MSILQLYFLVITFLGGKNLPEKEIVVIGNAENAKAGAVVVSVQDKKMYYVGGLSSWEEGVVGKKVKVTGKLKVEKFDPPKPGEEEKQRIVGEVRTLLKVKWELVK